MHPETPTVRVRTARRIRPVGWCLDGMVAVASGTSGRVKRWGTVLRAARIRFIQVECSWDGHGSRKHFELWVALEDADQARSALRDSGRTDGPVLW